MIALYIEGGVRNTQSMRYAGIHIRGAKLFFKLLIGQVVVTFGTLASNRAEAHRSIINQWILNHIRPHHSTRGEVN